MAITNYSELKTAASNWQHRTTTSFTGRVAEFIALFEASANAMIRLRENEVETALAATPVSAFINLPGNYQAPVSLKLTSTQHRLVFNAPDRLPYYPTQV